MRIFRPAAVPVLASMLFAQEPVSPPMPAVDASVRREAPQGRTNEITHHDITWRFDHYYQAGSFANGDPWVLGPVQVTAILPACTERNGRTVHGAMVDPDPSSKLHGYDSMLFGDYGLLNGSNRYRPELNAALGVAAGRPLELKPGQSLVSVESLAEPTQFSQLRTAAVLTCLGEEPPPQSFRPPYCKGDKRVRFSAARLDYTVLGRLHPAGQPPDLAMVAAQFERVWLDHTTGWISRFMHPVRNMRDYSRDFTTDVGTGALLLQLDLPNEKKRELLVRMVQFGIDSYGNLKGGCSWPGEGGQGSGRKFCILLAGAVLHEPELSAVGKDYPSERTSADQGTAWFGEDSQTFVVKETSPGVWNWGFGGYTREHDGLPEWGISHTSEPKFDDARWNDGNPYRRCCTANAWIGECLAARIMGLQEAWHHPALFAYMDRYLQTEPKGEWQRAWDSWHAAMWDAYRSQF